MTHFQGHGECRDKGDGGKTVHCLMRLAYKGELLSEQECEEELRILLKESNPLDTTDWRLDPVLQRSCQVNPYSNDERLSNGLKCTFEQATQY